MWSMTLRDLRYRRRRFAIAILGTALVFAMALVMAGMSASFRFEVDRVLGAIGADSWVVPDGVVGPFTSSSAFPAGIAGSITSDQDDLQTIPLVVLRQTVMREGGPTDVTVLGVEWSLLAAPQLSAGRPPRAAGEIVVDSSLDIPVGTTLPLGGDRFEIVGTSAAMTLLGGIPVVIAPVRDAQNIGFAGRALLTAVGVRGTPSEIPAGYTSLHGADARADLLRPLEKGIQAIDSVQILLWFVAAIIIAAVIYLSALERVRDFAVLKAVGASSSRLFGSLCLQSVIVSLVAALIAFALSMGLAPTFALPIRIPAAAFALLPMVALAVGVAASFSGLRRAIDVDPARAFGSA